MSATFFYVYILEGLATPRHHDTGFTENLHGRLDHPTSGSVPHIAKYRPWQIKTALAFIDRDRVLNSERYLKTGSGRALAMKRL